MCKDGVLNASLMHFVFEFMSCMVLNLVCLLVSENGSMRNVTFPDVSNMVKGHF